jgi:spore germination protein KA
MNIQDSVNEIKNLTGNPSELVTRNLIIGKETSIEAVVIYINGLADKNIIDRDILTPLMIHADEDFINIKNVDDYIFRKYITVGNSNIETDINKAVEGIKRGKTVVITQSSSNFIVVDTTGGAYRAIQEPVNDVSLKGPREGFVESLQINTSIMKRRIKDKNLVTEQFTLGVRSQTDLVIMYIDDVVDKEYLKKLREKINNINMDFVSENSLIEQCIEEHPYSIFPQVIGSERPDVVEANLMEGRIAFLLDGTSNVTTYPTIFAEFFQTPEDYYGRSILASFIRMIRIIAVFIVITVPAIYITLIKFNSEMIPIEFIESLVSSRKGIALTPFISLVSMQFTIELLREGGLRLPGKIGQTLSVVGGIIIGDAALKAKIVSSTTLLVAGISTVASFAISNYQMSLAVRSVAYPMLALANWLGMLGIVIGWFFILSYLCSLENLGVPYLSFSKNDMKDIFIRAPITKMDTRPDAIPNNNSMRQDNSRGGKNE